MSTTSQRTVVLAGGNVTARQSLATKLQTSLLSQSLEMEFFCPATPQDLAHTPADARHLLWRNPEDTACTSAHNGWRDQLHELQRAYQSLHAGSESVLQQAVFALVNGQIEAMKRPEIAGRRQGLCECCADPACEQKLFGRLLQG
ncbi:MAG: hypothetical protein EXR37_09190 [Limnohabitans sp.]|nr:hypothetical protein [Limnohabitans sp.]